MKVLSYISYLFQMALSITSSVSYRRVDLNLIRGHKLNSKVYSPKRNRNRGLKNIIVYKGSLIEENQDFFRSLPIYCGGIGFFSLVVNRGVSGIAPVIDSSSSQSRADVLGIVLSAVLLLTGLQWLSLKPKEQEPVEINGQPINFYSKSLKSGGQLQMEIDWAWESLQNNTNCCSFAVFYKGELVALQGLAAKSNADLEKVKAGPLCASAIESGQGNYLANLSLFPGKVELEPYFPDNIQGVVINPIGKKGVLVCGCNVKRGFGRLDQAWISMIADKLDNTIEVAPSMAGVGFAS